MPLLEDYREFFDFSPDWPGQKFGDLREREEKRWKIRVSGCIMNISQIA